MHVEQYTPILVRVNDRGVADRVRTARDTGVNLAKGDFVGDLDGGLDARAAGALQVIGRGPDGQAGFDDGAIDICVDDSFIADPSPRADMDAIRAVCGAGIGYTLSGSTSARPGGPDASLCRPFAQSCQATRSTDPR